MKKILTVLLALLLTISMFTVPTALAAGTATAAEVDVRGKTVGLAMHFLMDDYAKFFVEAFKKVMDEAGVKYEITDANANPVQQLDDVTNFFTKEVDGMVIVPFDENAVRDKINEMAKAGIPVVAVTYMPATNVVGTVPGGDYENGFLAGQLLREKMGESGEVYIFDTPIVAFRMSERIRGFRAALNGSSIVIDSVKTSVTPESFMNITIDLLNSDPKLTGIFANFGNPAIGAGTALQQLNRKDITLVSIDADYSVMQLIKEGWVDGAAAQFPAVHGQKAAELILQALRGQPVDSNVEIPHQIVTSENVEEMSVTLWGKTL
jgi:ABC-type sugar transport system substrate-binding protein